MIYKVGLTGGIGSGKSTVAKFFAEQGVPIFSADQIGHELSQKSGAAYPAIVKAFGNGILNQDQEINRTALGNIIFKDDVLKTELEAILHPRIMQTMHQRAESAQGLYCMLDIPLLINTAERDKVNRILVVQCQQDMRIARIKKRNGWSEEKIQAVMDSQASEQSLVEAADDLIDNNRTPAHLSPQVTKLHQQYMQLAEASLSFYT